MAQSHNRVELMWNIDRLGGNPELRYTGEGTPVASFRLAYREHEDKVGVRRVAIEIVVGELVPLDSRPDSQPADRRESDSRDDDGADYDF